MKYVFITVSANFGNMLSVAGASLFLTFLPLLPKQILTLSLLSDMPAAAITTDKVEPRMVERPRRWNLGFITRFMIVFGLISTVFDFLTFVILLTMIDAGPAEFRTGWFVVSLVTELLVLLVLRDQGRVFSSKPSNYLTVAIVGVLFLTFLMPYSDLGIPLELTPLGFVPMLLLTLISALYITYTEVAKRVFYSRVSL